MAECKIKSFGWHDHGLPLSSCCTPEAPLSPSFTYFVMTCLIRGVQGVCVCVYESVLAAGMIFF